jgi:ATP-dependent DNA ligase
MRQDLSTLLSRCHGSTRRAAELSRQHPAMVVAFDVLATPEGDLRRRPYRERRRELELLLAAYPTAATLTPMTTDVDEAELWMKAWAEHGMEGLVAKYSADPYLPGARR